MGTKAKKVLIVSYAFPPADWLAAQRIGKLAKYLPDFGWEPIVLTTNKRYALQTLPVEINESNIVRAPSFSLGRYIHQLPILRMLPHPLGWYPYAITAGYRIINTHEIDAIFSSSFPSSPHFVASWLQRRSGIPWIAEFRDLWALNPHARTTPFFRFLEQKMEKRVMKNSSWLISVSPGWTGQLDEMHHKGVSVIPNGFDEEDYSANVPLMSKFNITYTGNTHPGRLDPSPLFEAVSQLRCEGKVSPANFEIRFFGINLADFIPSLIKKYHLEELAKFYGFVPYRQSIKRQKESTVLLILVRNRRSEKDTCTGKIYGYLGAQRPILATSYPGGAIDSLLGESGTGILTNEVEKIKEILCCWLEEWYQSGKIISYWQPNINVVKRYTRKEEARKLAQLLEEVST